MDSHGPGAAEGWQAAGESRGGAREQLRGSWGGGWAVSGHFRDRSGPCAVPGGSLGGPRIRIVGAELPRAHMACWATFWGERLRETRPKTFYGFPRKNHGHKSKDFQICPPPKSCRWELASDLGRDKSA